MLRECVRVSESKILISYLPNLNFDEPRELTKTEERLPIKPRACARRLPAARRKGCVSATELELACSGKNQAARQESSRSKAHRPSANRYCASENGEDW